ncbi:MAG: hypothetical protein DCC64_16010 [Planctomycetota bacterium]|nr:MAG: hypothetical protein DCC64_16010 [Planctomycetota bacterium]
MVAFKPLGERGPTVYRDMTGIEPEAVERLSRSPFEGGYRQAGSDEPRTARADTPRPGPAESAAKESGAARIEEKVLWELRQLSRMVEHLLWRAAQQPASAYLHEGLPWLEPQATASPEGSRQAEETTQRSDDPKELRRMLERIRERTEGIKVGPRAGERPEPKGEDLFPVPNLGEKEREPRPGGSKLFPVPEDLVERPRSIFDEVRSAAEKARQPGPLGDRLDSDLPPTMMPHPLPDPFLELDEERRKQEEWRYNRRIWDWISRELDWGRPTTHERPWWFDPPTNQREAEQRKQEVGIPKIREGVGVLGPIALIDVPTGLWGGRSLGGNAFVGGMFVEMPIGENGVVRLGVGAVVDPNSRIPIIGGEGVITIPFR